MNLADELRKLHELHRNGSLTDAEFAAAKARVLSQADAASGPGADQTMQQHLEEIKRQNEIAQLDRQWALERDRYMVPGNHGVRHLPSKGMSLFGGIAVAVFGAFWVAMASNIAGGMGGMASFFPLFGVLFIAVGVGMSIYSFTKASQYEEAHARYLRRRAELLGADRATADRPAEAGFADERIQE
ncbi:MAG: SHOCT domain-containing protein [Gemmataceae bacterium]|nr:SHOCT domain-containing protein [Gemmataceae bacterium]